MGAIPPWQSPHPLPISCPNMTSPGSLCKGCSAGDDDDGDVDGVSDDGNDGDNKLDDRESGA